MVFQYKNNLKGERQNKSIRLAGHRNQELPTSSRDKQSKALRICGKMSGKKLETFDDVLRSDES